MRTVALILGIAWLVQLDELRIVKVRDWALTPGKLELKDLGTYHYQLIRPLSKQKDK